MSKSARFTLEDVSKLSPAIQAQVAAEIARPKSAIARPHAVVATAPAKPRKSKGTASGGASSSASIYFHGQIRGGKNNYIVTRTGMHIPRKEWAAWRDKAVSSVRAQLPATWVPIETPTAIRLTYVAGDKRRRDQPAVIDAIFHVLEKAGFCKDDTLLWVSESTRSYDKEAPHAVIEII